MSLITTTIDSSILKKEMKLAVYHPDVSDTIALPVLYFLHGRTGNETLLSWLGIVLTVGADVALRTGEVFCEEPIPPAVLTDSPEQEAAAWIHRAMVNRSCQG